MFPVAVESVGEVEAGPGVWISACKDEEEGKSETPKAAEGS